MSECPGHFGHIELARPVFHPGAWSEYLLNYIMLTRSLFRVSDESEENFGVYMCQLREIEGGHREFVFFSFTRFAPHHPIFWGLSPLENPKPALRSFLMIKAFFHPRCSLRAFSVA